MNDPGEQLFIKFKRILIILSSLILNQIRRKFESVFGNSNDVNIPDYEDRWSKIKDKVLIIRSIIDRIDINCSRQRVQIENIIMAATKLGFIQDNIIYNDESANDIWNDDTILRQLSINQSEFSNRSNDIFMNIADLIDRLPDAKVFDHKEPNDPNNDIKKLFLFYDEMGKYIYESPQYRGSNLEKLEDILFNAEDGVQRHIKIRPEMNRLELSKAFIALVSPSLTGKTQSVFVMRRVRALYFCFQDPQSENELQQVYRLFDSFNYMLADLSALDMNTLSRNFADRLQQVYRQENEIIRLKSMNDGMQRTLKTFAGLYSEISANNLENGDSYKNFKFFTLGFLKGLIEHAEENYTIQDRRSWMKYYAEAKRISFPAITVRDFKAFYSRVPNKYYVFMDEFVGKCSAVLVRNLCRAVGLRCVTANTNSDVVNLLGIRQSIGSRKDKRTVWSIVMTLLNPITFDDMEFADKLNNALEMYFLSSHSTITGWHFVNEPTDQLNSEIERIILNGSPCDADQDQDSLINLITCVKQGHPPDGIDFLSTESEKINLARFFLDFKLNQICHLRPGLAFILPYALKSFTKPECTVNELIGHLVSFVSYELYSRKTELIESIHGRVGSLALFLKNSYETEKISATIEHRKSFLKNHFYYLLNPSDKSAFFLTVAPGEYDERLRVFYKTSESSDTKTCTWDYELTYFDKNELVTILACISSRFSMPIAIDIKKGEYESLRGNIDLGRTPNQLSMKSDGNALEVLATSTIIEASQHEHGNSSISFIGQNGISFIQNIILNLMSGKAGESRGKLIKISFPRVTRNSSFNLKNILQNFKIPFLYISNAELPTILSSLTCLNVGDCYRTSDKDQVDINFACEYASAEESKPVQQTGSNRKRTRTRTSIAEPLRVIQRKLKFRAIAECKNYANCVPVSELKRIIEKALKQNDSRLSLVFCTKIRECSMNTFKIFCEFCKDNDVRVFRFVKIGEDSFEPVHFNTPKLSNRLPRIICLVFEITEIDY